jgi:KTSC domain
MPSSVIRRFLYVPDELRLEILFVTGKRYSYFDVPADVYEAMQRASSKGEFFNKHIRDRYRFVAHPENISHPNWNTEHSPLLSDGGFMERTNMANRNDQNNRSDQSSQHGKQQDQMKTGQQTGQQQGQRSQQGQGSQIKGSQGHGGQGSQGLGGEANRSSHANRDQNNR